MYSKFNRTFLTISINSADLGYKQGNVIDRTYESSKGNQTA